MGEPKLIMPGRWQCQTICDDILPIDYRAYVYLDISGLVKADRYRSSVSA